MAEINRKMIILAREARGLGQNDLGEKINMSATNVGKIERDEIGINKTFLHQVAEVTDFPLQFFYQQGDSIPENLAFRKRKKVPQKLISPIFARGNIYRRHVQFLWRMLQIPSSPLPHHVVTAKNSPSDIAIAFTNKWVKQPFPKQGILRLIEDMGIPVIAFDFDTERVDSFSMMTDDNLPVIFVNKRLLGDRLRFTLAYELGHLIMHIKSTHNPNRDLNQEANIFAAELLMPAKHITGDLNESMSIAMLGTLKKKWKVSMIALLYRAEALNIITANQKKYLLHQFNTMGIRRREPIEFDTPIEKPALMGRWLSEYKAKTKFSVVEIAATLCMKVDEYLEMYG